VSAIPENAAFLPVAMAPETSEEVKHIRQLVQFMDIIDALFV